MSIDLNCDIGESFGAYRLGADAEVMPQHHVGQRRVRLSRRRSGRDAADGPAGARGRGRGRRASGVPRPRRVRPSGNACVAAEVEDLVLYQIGALAAIAASEGVPLAHVKAHGALYNMAARDRTLADAIARAVRAFDRSLVLFGLPAPSS